MLAQKEQQSEPSRASDLDDELARGRDFAIVSLEQHCRGAELLHDRGSRDLCAGRKRVALIDWAAHPLLGVREIDVAVAGGLGGARPTEPREREPGAPA